MHTPASIPAVQGYNQHGLATWKVDAQVSLDEAYEVNYGTK
jgi:hypothetical protein